MILDKLWHQKSLNFLIKSHGIFQIIPIWWKKSGKSLEFRSIFGYIYTKIAFKCLFCDFATFSRKATKIELLDTFPSILPTHD